MSLPPPKGRLLDDGHVEWTHDCMTGPVVATLPMPPWQVVGDRVEPSVHCTADLAAMTANRDQAVNEVQVQSARAERAGVALADLRAQVLTELDTAHEPATHATMLGLARRLMAIDAPGATKAGPAEEVADRG